MASDLLRFSYTASEVSGTETNLVQIARWRPPFETAGGSWQTVAGNISYVNDYFETPSGFASSGFTGDWTIANQAFRRIFFSRATGNWNDVNTWTFSPTHIGPSAGVFPSAADDSVQIGGGNLGTSDHVVTLNISPSITISGIAVGTSSSNTGTLDMGANTILGQVFNLNDYSTLRIGSPQVGS